LAVAGISPVHAAGASDLALRNINTDAFEVYDIADNQWPTARNSQKRLSEFHRIRAHRSSRSPRPFTNTPKWISSRGARSKNDANTAASPIACVTGSKDLVLGPYLELFACETNANRN
jgi:hypothetical protein